MDFHTHSNRWSQLGFALSVKEKEMEAMMTAINQHGARRPGEEEPEVPPPPHSQPEPDVPLPDDETRDLVNPVKT